jgi:uncharacterized protein YdeI (YjbR/CyaY-like superfamily)
MKPRFFKSQSAWRAWLEKNHDSAQELLVGFHRKASRKPSITWPESVDEALCFGWIDGVRRRIDDTSYTIRFTPRRPGSVWSSTNIKRAKELDDLGLMQPAGRAAFEARKEDRSGIYSYEQRRNVKLDPVDESAFKANATAWEFFRSTAPSYQRTAIWWVVSGKQEATRARRLAKLIDESAKGRTLAPFTRPG